MPLKSRTQDNRAARTATPESTESDNVVNAVPGDAAETQTTATTGGRGARRPASASKPAETASEKPAPAKRGRPAGAGAKKAATLPPAGDKKASKARMKAILAEAKVLQKERKTALKDLGDEFDDKLKALKAEYGTLAAQASADAFPA